MKPKNKLVLLVLITVSFSFLFSLPLKNSSAEPNQLIFQKDSCYDVYYVLQDHEQYIANVKIIDIVVIGAVPFLEIQSVQLPQDKSGYILFSSIRAILPVGYLKPQKIGNK